MRKAPKRANASKKKTPSPRLSTILMVEDTLKNMNYSLIKVSELKRILPKKVNHNVLIEILDYLNNCNKIVMGPKGIVWTINDSPKLRKAIEKGTIH